MLSVEVIPAVSGQAAVNKKYFLLWHTALEKRVNHITVSRSILSNVTIILGSDTTHTCYLPIVSSDGTCNML